MTVVDRGQIKVAKLCAQCNKVMTMRKAWEHCWHDVKYCSDACREKAKHLKLAEDEFNHSDDH